MSSRGPFNHSVPAPAALNTWSGWQHLDPVATVCYSRRRGCNLVLSRSLHRGTARTLPRAAWAMLSITPTPTTCSLPTPQATIHTKSPIVPQRQPAARHRWHYQTTKKNDKTLWPNGRHKPAAVQIHRRQLPAHRLTPPARGEWEVLPTLVTCTAGMPAVS